MHRLRRALPFIWIADLLFICVAWLFWQNNPRPSAIGVITLPVPRVTLYCTTATHCTTKPFPAYGPVDPVDYPGITYCMACQGGLLCWVQPIC